MKPFEQPHYVIRPMTGETKNPDESHHAPPLRQAAIAVVRREC